MNSPLIHTVWPDNYDDPRFTLSLDFILPSDPQGQPSERDDAEARTVRAAIARIQEIIEGDATLRILLETQRLVLYRHVEDRFGTV